MVDSPSFHKQQKRLDGTMRQQRTINPGHPVNNTDHRVVLDKYPNLIVTRSSPLVTDDHFTPGTGHIQFLNEERRNHVSSVEHRFVADHAPASASAPGAQTTTTTLRGSWPQDAVQHRRHKITKSKTSK